LLREHNFRASEVLKHPSHVNMQIGQTLVSRCHPRGEEPGRTKITTWTTGNTLTYPCEWAWSWRLDLVMNKTTQTWTSSSWGEPWEGETKRHIDFLKLSQISLPPARKHTALLIFSLGKCTISRNVLQN
jgi:hypothetical protein